MKPTIGRIVIYKLTTALKEQLRENNKGEWLVNIQDTLPAMIVAVWNDTCVNLKVFVDGHIKDLWITSAVQGDQEGQWNWPKIDNEVKHNASLQGIALKSF